MLCSANTAKLLLSILVVWSSLTGLIADTQHQSAHQNVPNHSDNGRDSSAQSAQPPISFADHYPMLTCSIILLFLFTFTCALYLLPGYFDENESRQKRLQQRQSRLEARWKGT